MFLVRAGVGVDEEIVSLVNSLLVSLWLLGLKVVGHAGVRGHDVQSCQEQKKETDLTSLILTPGWHGVWSD